MPGGLFVDTKRKEEMIAFTKELLAEATKGCGVVERLGWLLAHLDEYLERWRGFSNIDGVSMKSVLKNDLHVVLLMGVALVDEEMARIDVVSPLRKEWDQFTRLTYILNDQSSKDIGQQLSTQLAVVERELAKEAGCPAPLTNDTTNKTYIDFRRSDGN